MGLPVLSVLIPTLPSRRSAFTPALLDDLERQAAGKPVELICLYDNFVSTTGRKRNLLLAMAQGRFSAFIDDDDRVAPDYVDQLLGTIGSNPDALCIVFDVLYCAAGDPPVPVQFGVELPHGRQAGGFSTCPNHLMAWNTELARTMPYMDTTGGEDTRWARAMAPLLPPERQIRIAATLYYYEDRRQREWSHARTSGMERWLATEAADTPSTARPDPADRLGE